MVVPAKTEKGYAAEQIIIRAYLKYINEIGSVAPYISVLYIYSEVGNMCRPKYKAQRVGDVIRNFNKGIIKLDPYFEG